MKVTFKHYLMGLILKFNIYSFTKNFQNTTNGQQRLDIQLSKCINELITKPLDPR